MVKLITVLALMLATPVSVSGGPRDWSIDSACFEDQMPGDPPYYLEAEIEVIVECKVERDKRLKSCRVLKEEPKGHGYGEATIRVRERCATYVGDGRPGPKRERFTHRYIP